MRKAGKKFVMTQVDMKEKKIEKWYKRNRVHMVGCVGGVEVRERRGTMDGGDMWEVIRKRRG